MERSMKKRFNLLDLALILLALLAIVGLWQRNNLKRLFSDKELLEEYVITFEVKRVRSTTAQLLDKDVALYTDAGEESVVLGKLTQPVAVSPATVFLAHSGTGTGTVEMVEAVYPQDEYEYYQDVGGELSCRGIERGGSFFLDGKLLLVKGQQIAARTETIDIVITVTDYRKVA
jgi:hypothetical protein